MKKLTPRGSATAAQVKTLYLQTLLAEGILTAGSHNMCYAHSEADLEQLGRAQDKACALLRQALDAGEVAKHLKGAPIEPVFRVR